MHASAKQYHLPACHTVCHARSNHEKHCSCCMLLYYNIIVPHHCLLDPVLGPAHVLPCGLPPSPCPPHACSCISTPEHDGTGMLPAKWAPTPTPGCRRATPTSSSPCSLASQCWWWPALVPWAWPPPPPSWWVLGWPPPAAYSSRGGMRWNGPTRSRPLSLIRPAP